MNKITKNILNTVKTCIALTLISSQTYTSADDTEVYLNSGSKPNLLFIFDVSGSMAWGLNGTGFDPSTGLVDVGNPPSRLDIMKNSIRRVLIQAPDGINIGVMNYGPGGFDGANSRLLWDESYRSHGVDGIAYPIKGINEKALPVVQDYLSIDNLPDPTSTAIVREYISDIVDGWQPYGGTPIVDSLAEAARYFGGEKMYFGQDIPSSPRGSHPSTYEGNPVSLDLINEPRDYASSPEYVSPIANGCQKNFIALLSDGQPTYYYEDQTEVIGKGKNAYLSPTADWGKGLGPFATFMKGDATYGTLAGGISNCVDSPNGFKAGTCGPEIAQFMANQDVSTEFSGDQHIQMFTVGYSRSIDVNTQNYLKSLVTVEDNPKTPWVEGYYSADDGQKLKKALFDIIDEVIKSSETLGSPSYSVNVQSGLEHEDSIYIPVFKKSDTTMWSGNLKKFSIVNSSENGKELRLIKGKNNLNAVDEQGVFTDDALDLWSESDVADGADLEKGGVANKLNPNARKLYSDIVCDTGSCSLTATDNHLVSSNKNITNSLLDPDGSFGIKTANDRKQLIDFIRGLNTDNSPRYHMGDMLHSKPLVITYNSASETSAKKQYVFVGTNEGYLHAFDTYTGEEVFAFMPKELLKNIDPQFRNVAGKHLYGIDGAISYWQDPATNKRYLYFGMRRGGTTYYALDITSINDPKLIWKKSSDDYPTMGQSWSPPYLARVGVGDLRTKKEVVIISGGYDEADDRDLRTYCATENDTCVIPANTSATVWYGANDTWVSKSDVTGSIQCSNKVFGDPLVGVVKSCKVELDNAGYDAQLPVTVGKGNDVLILDAKTGEKIWSLSNGQRSQISSSIPGGLRIIDTNYNNLIDRIYFADTGGNVWRLDLSEALGNGKSTLTKLASLGGNGTDSRKFYNEPDVAIMKHKGNTIYTVSVGSGFRAHPMDESINDKFFVLVDDSPFKPLGTGFNDIELSDLATIDITGGGDAVSVSSTGTFFEGGKRGWSITFPSSGEKVLSKAITIEGVVAFTTFTPNDTSTASTSCGIEAGAVGRLYAINILTGEPGLQLDLVEGEITDNDVRTPPMPGILPPLESIFNTPEVITEDDGNGGTKKSCKHVVDLRLSKKLSQISGYDACRLEKLYWSDPSGAAKE